MEHMALLLLCFYIVPINKYTFVSPSIGDFGGTPPPLTRQQRIFLDVGGGPFSPGSQVFWRRLHK